MHWGMLVLFLKTAPTEKPLETKCDNDLKIRGQCHSTNVIIGHENKNVTMTLKATGPGHLEIH